jgi:hypothetical protein
LVDIIEDKARPLIKRLRLSDLKPIDCFEADEIADILEHLLFTREVVNKSVDDVISGRGMFGLNPKEDLDWAVKHITEAYQRVKI